MRSLVSLVICACCIAAGRPHSHRGDSPSAQSKTFAIADSLVQEYARSYPGISVSVSQHGRLVWNSTAGFLNVERKEAVVRSTKFNIYSTAKFITGLAFLRLVQTGQIPNLDVKVVDIDPSLPPAYRDITLRHILTRTSGIRHYSGDRDWKRFSDLRCVSPREALQYFINDPLRAQPGKKEIYSTYAMVLASHLLEVITGRPFIDAVNDLLPLSEKLTLDSDTAPKATPYYKRGRQFRSVPRLSAECKFGGGGIIASSDQLAEIGQLFYNESIIPLPKLKQLFQYDWPAGKQNGTSFAISSGIDRGILYSNMGGGALGGRSYLLVRADLKIAVAITANYEGDGMMAYRLAAALANAFGAAN